MRGISRRAFLATAALAGCAHRFKGTDNGFVTGYDLGFTVYRTNRATRFENQITMRAWIAEEANGSWNSRAIASELAGDPHAWTQFAGWTPDGGSAVVGRGWETPENAAWEEEHKTFRMTEGWLYDMFLVDMQSGEARNLTEVERVSAYNTGLLFMPGDENTLGFTALIDGVSHPFLMDRDGRNKRDLNQGEDGFSYGFSASPDGTRVAYHKDYQVFVADADGNHARQIETGNPFNFVPQWSPDGAWLMFVSGEHYDCHPHVVRPDGTGLRKLADRGGYEGVTPVIDVYDFHGGSSDVPVWSHDGGSIFYTAKVEDAIELMRVTLDGTIEQLTHSEPGTAHYHPKMAPDGRSLVFGSNRSGLRQLYVMAWPGKAAVQVTQVPEGYGAMWAHWRPKG